MKFKSLLALSTLMIPFVGSAVKASPELITVKNPDGTTLQVRAYGDEFFHYVTDADGEFLMTRNNAGVWTQAVINGKTLKHNDTDLAIYRDANPVALSSRVSHQRNMPKRMAQIGFDERTTYNTSGTVKSLVILVEFADVKFNCSDPRQSYWNLCNQEGYSEYGSCGSARDYFIDISNGQFLPEFDVYGPVTLAHNQAYYAENGGPTGTESRDKIYELVYEAVTALDGEVNFADYDLDENGTIDNIFFYYAGHGQADTMDPTTIWPHQGDYRQYVRWAGATQIVVDGKEMATYACGNELKGRNPNGGSDPWRDGIGTFCHEYGHVLGLPDFYDTLNTNQGTTSKVFTPGYFDIMDSGSYNRNSTCPPGYSAYERWLCKWIEYEEATPGERHYVSDLTFGPGTTCTAKVIRIPRSATVNYSECFIVESRSSSKWDASLPARGMFIWHVDYDEKCWADNQVNVKENGERYKLMPSYVNGLTRRYTWPGGENDYTDWTSYITPESEYALTPYSRSPKFAPWITSITYDFETGKGSFGYNVITEQPDCVTHMRTPTRGEDGTRELYFKWDEYPGAIDYLLTIYRVSETGTLRYVNNCNKLSTKGATSYEIKNLTEAAWKDKFTAFVTVVYEMESSRNSNQVEFYPADLADVDFIVESVPSIHGGVGCINAPSGARAYNINGVETGLENLAAGIYIVSYNGQSTKVVVK